MHRLASIGAIAVAVGAWFAFPWLDRTLFVGEFDFTPLEDSAGFRRISTGNFSGGWDPLAGMTGAPRAVGNGATQRDGSDLCPTLFGAAPLTADTVPIAFFTDYRCPYCRVLSKELTAIEDEEPDKVRIAWHEWPMLGHTSELAAKAALAAKRQGAYAAFHDRLVQTSFVPTAAYLRSVSERIGVDADRLLEDMESIGVEDELSKTRGLAALFGFPGTPGLVVGRTVVVGAIGDAQLRALIEREIADGPFEPCQAHGGRSR